MALNLRLSLRIHLAAFFITGCGYTVIPPILHKCQAVIVVDKTNSVSYIARLPKLQVELSNNLYRTYACATKNILCSRLVITGGTRVFPDRDYFNEEHPEGDEDSRIYQQNLQRWSTAKRKWISDEVEQVVSLIQNPCHSNSTDIFSIFSGIQQVQDTDGHWDSVNVYIFSDMINTSHQLNMISGINDGNAEKKGKIECQHMIEQGKISKENIDNLYLTIYTPDNLENSNKVNQFWKGFFDQWGLSRNHYRFE